VSIYVA